MEVNHNRVDSIWITIRKKASRKSGISLEEAVEEALCFGWIDGRLRRVDSERFALRLSPRKANSVWSKINKDRAEKLIESQRMTIAGLTKIEEAKKSGWWNSAYTNRYEDKIPIELEIALKREQPAWENFRRFANSYKNTYIGWVTSAKTNKTKLKRIEIILKQAKENRKTISP